MDDFPPVSSASLALPAATCASTAADGGASVMPAAYRVEHQPVVDPDQLFLWFTQAAGHVPRSAAPDGTRWSLGVRKGADVTLPGDGYTLKRLPPIAGGSDEHEVVVPNGRATEMARHTPQRS